jgi:hypothetical protein
VSCVTSAVPHRFRSEPKRRRRLRSVQCARNAVNDELRTYEIVEIVVGNRVRRIGPFHLMGGAYSVGSYGQGNLSATTGFRTITLWPERRLRRHCSIFPKFSLPPRDGSQYQLFDVAWIASVQSGNRCRNEVGEQGRSGI